MLKSIGKFFQRLFTLIGILAVLGGIAFYFREAILGEFGEFLIRQDDLRRSEAIFVLSGSPMDRNMEAASLLKQEVAGVIVVTGENINGSASVLEKNGIIDDAHLSKRALMNMGVDSTKIEMLPKGTSTYEEARYILQHAQEKKWKRIVIVSSLHHTRRVGRVFHKRFKNSGIELIIRGCPTLSYKPEKWWEYEEGLLMVTNEYIKGVYYILKGRL